MLYTLHSGNADGFGHDADDGCRGEERQLRFSIRMVSGRQVWRHGLEQAFNVKSCERRCCCSGQDWLRPFQQYGRPVRRVNYFDVFLHPADVLNIHQVEVK